MASSTPWERPSSANPVNVISSVVSYRHGGRAGKAGSAVAPRGAYAAERGAHSPVPRVAPVPGTLLGVATLHVTGLRKSYGTHVIYDGVSFRLPPVSASP